VPGQGAAALFPLEAGAAEQKEADPVWGRVQGFVRDLRRGGAFGALGSEEETQAAAKRVMDIGARANPRGEDREMPSRTQFVSAWLRFLQKELPRMQAAGLSPSLRWVLPGGKGWAAFLRALAESWQRAFDPSRWS
jgi:hypothetical protein